MSSPTVSICSAATIPRCATPTPAVSTAPCSPASSPTPGNSQASEPRLSYPRTGLSSGRPSEPPKNYNQSRSHGVLCSGIEILFSGRPYECKECVDRFWPGSVGGSGRRATLCPPKRREDAPPAQKEHQRGRRLPEDAADYLREQAENLSKEAQKTIKRTKGQVEEVVDKVSDAAAGAVKGVQSLM